MIGSLEETRNVLICPDVSVSAMSGHSDLFRKTGKILIFYDFFFTCRTSLQIKEKLCL